MEYIKDILVNGVHPELARRIIRDFKLPFNYINQEQFAETISHMIIVSPEYWNVEEMLLDICHNVERANQPTLCQYISDIICTIPEEIKSSIGYDKFNSIDINTILPLHVDTPKGDVYIEDNVGKHFISIDLKNAAFQALHF
jgi:hypothetical protein